MIMIFNLADRSYPSIQATLYPGRHWKGYFLRQLRNFSMRRRWVLEILFGSS
jgi:hypothetical protein